MLDKTSLSRDQIGEYSGDAQGRPARDRRHLPDPDPPAAAGQPSSPHLELFDQRNWGLIIYDEVHLLPAPVFQITASLQARRRLGLTATLVREDGREDDVFALIGPKKYDVPWKELESQGWIATAICTEIRLPMPEARRMAYALAEARHKFRIASENPDKLRLVRQIARPAPRRAGADHRHVRGADRSSSRANWTCRCSPAPPANASGTTLYRASSSRASCGCWSFPKIANFSVDLPDAAVAIQISGTFGSRQEEAQRLGRILRPKAGPQPGALLHARQRRHRRAGFRLEAPVVPVRTRLHLRNR